MPPLSKQQSRQDSSIRHERSPAQHNKLSPGPPGSFYHILSTEGPKKIGPEVLAQLQTPSADKSDVLDTELNLADDPDSWDVINPNTRNEEDWDRDFYSLEKRAEQLYSPAHLRLILEVQHFPSPIQISIADLNGRTPISTTNSPPSSANTDPGVSRSSNTTGPPAKPSKLSTTPTPSPPQSPPNPVSKLIAEL